MFMYYMITFFNSTTKNCHRYQELKPNTLNRNRWASMLLRWVNEAWCSFNRVNIVLNPPRHIFLYLKLTENLFVRDFTSGNRRIIPWDTQRSSPGISNDISQIWLFWLESYFFSVFCLWNLKSLKLRLAKGHHPLTVYNMEFMLDSSDTAWN